MKNIQEITMGILVGYMSGSDFEQSPFSGIITSHITVQIVYICWSWVCTVICRLDKPYQTERAVIWKCEICAWKKPLHMRCVYKD